MFRVGDVVRHKAYRPGETTVVAHVLSRSIETYWGQDQFNQWILVHRKDIETEEDLTALLEADYGT